MVDKRSVDDLSIEELERILALKKRQARQAQLRRMESSGRVVAPAGTTIPAARPALPGTAPADDHQPRYEDGVPLREYSKRKHDDGRLWRRFVDRSLLLVEALAVIGLVILGATFLQGIGRLEEETSAAQHRAEEQIRAAIPTIAPTPVLKLAQIVLPGGHTPDGRFNFEEVPASLRDQIRDLVSVPLDYQRPAPTLETARRIVIPEIGVDQVIVQGTDEEALQLGVGQLLNGVTPGTSGNLVLAAHNDVYGKIFRYLDELQPGMLFEVHTEQKIYTYIITGTSIVDPDDVHVMDDQGRPTATLISCYPYQVNNKRIVVFADRVDT
ncbi:MAG: sortase [Anaerolineae bacterium]|nr:sortase [Anaerolineae bacterium]